MALFDKRSRLLKDKILDLNVRLAKAAQEKDYRVEQGVYFANLPDMGESTQILMAADLHAGEEDSVIRAFFDRNGFKVGELKLERSHGRVHDIEIDPPEELVTSMAIVMRSEDFHIVDDREQTQAFDFLQRICPISALSRALCVLFTEKAKKIIEGSAIKRTREGNRLLSWMPEVGTALRKKVDGGVIYALEYYFDEAFEHFYSGDLRKDGGEKSQFQVRLEKAVESGQTGEFSIDQLFQAPEPAKAAPPKPAPAKPQTGPPAEQPISFDDRVLSRKKSAEQPAPSARPAAHDEEEMRKLKRGAQLTKTLAIMYRSLVDTAPADAARNAEALLQHLNQLFRALASCVLVRERGSDSMTPHARAGEPLAWSSASGRSISGHLVRECVKRRSVASGVAPDGPGADQDAASRQVYAAAVPLLVNDSIQGVLYLERQCGKEGFRKDHLKMLSRLAQIFEEFPHLTLGSPRPSKSEQPAGV